MTHVVNLIVDAIVDQLTFVCQTSIDEDELTYADIVKKGLLQENRTKKNVVIAVVGGDHEDPSYIDGIVTLGDFKDIAMDVPPREIGGGELWYRRGVIRVEAYFVKERLEESEAWDAAYEILGRVQSNIQNIMMSGIEDSFGERAIKLFSYGNTFFQSGGAPKFIFRGKVYWTCLTERS